MPIGLPTAATVKSRKSHWANGIFGICSQTHCVSSSSQMQVFSSHKSMCFGKKLTPHTCANWASNSCNSQISKIPLGQWNSWDLLTDSLCEQWSQNGSVQQSQKHVLWQKVDTSHLCQLGFQQLQQSNLENPVGPMEFWRFAHRLTV